LLDRLEAFGQARRGPAGQQFAQEDEHGT
jgi:hypothetical protein